jgi:group I intron endonuclease
MRGQVDYSKGLIYGIYCKNNNDLYIGSTTNMTKRWWSHKSCIKNKYENHTKLYKTMAENGIENYYIELIENYPCNSKKELERREGQIQREKQPNLNGRFQK